MIHVSPETFAAANMNVVIMGDKDLDSILSEGMPEPSLDIPGRAIWRIDRGEGQMQTITALDMGYIQNAVSD